MLNRTANHTTSDIASLDVNCSGIISIIRITLGTYISNRSALFLPI